LGGGAGAELGSVFVEGGVADVVDLIFDGPVAADDGGESSGGDVVQPRLVTAYTTSRLDFPVRA